MSFKQCHKKLWLELHRQDLCEHTTEAQSRFDVGDQIGELARKLYDSKGDGVHIDIEADGYAEALFQSGNFLQSAQPVFEAGFSAAGAVAFADVMLPHKKKGALSWKMVEVKSTTSVKDYHLDDAAIQAYVAHQSGVDIHSIAIAHIDSAWVYRGDGYYGGLLVEADVTQEVNVRLPEVGDWIKAAHGVARKRKEPLQSTGGHCNDPFECGFLDYCQSQEPKVEYPVHWLPRIQTKALKSFIEEEMVTDFSDIPDTLLNDKQLRVKDYTLADEVYFDPDGAQQACEAWKFPLYFLDFETIQFAIPQWRSTQPYQQVPFQFSVHKLDRNGNLTQESFIDISGKDPRKAFAEALIEACGTHGSVVVYNAGFEKTVIRKLGSRMVRLNGALKTLSDRVVDLLPVVERHYYHPSQQGSWSIKKVLPAIAPDLSYEALEGVKDGGMAMDAYMEAQTRWADRDQIKKQLLDYCALDTYAMVRVWQYMADRFDMKV